MTTICSCIYPKWVIDEMGTEYFAVPTEVAQELGIQRHETDLILTINYNGEGISTDGKGIDFIAVPFDAIEDRQIYVPDTEVIEQEVDGIVRLYMVVMWKEPIDEYVKKYDVRGHIFVAGCEPSHLKENEEGKLQCDEKSIFITMHPIDEWVDHHIVELGIGQYTKQSKKQQSKKQDTKVSTKHQTRHLA